MRIFFLIIIVLGIISCKTKPITMPMPDKKLVTEQFLENPFGHSNSVEDFKQNQPVNFKIQQAEVQNKYYENLTDTVYRLAYKNSVINVVASRGKQRFLMADVQNSKIIFDGNIVVGMAQEDVISRFHHFPKFQRNVVTVYSKDQNTRCTFVFKKEILNRVRCENVTQ